MQRYKIILEYDGTFFCGWQRQASDEEAHEFLSEHYAQRRKAAIIPTPPLMSIQGLVEFALYQILHQHLLVEGAGRTDTGVHAYGQCAHIDLENPIDSARLREGLNFYTRNWGVVIRAIEPVSSTFHARFSARMRTYHYLICNRPAPLALYRNRAWHVATPLNIARMQAAAQQFLGFHDFSAFRAAECQSKSPHKTLHAFHFEQNGENIQATISARSFLHNQVRIMMGTLVQIGKGKMPAEIITQLLENPDRVKAGPTAPPYGLYLHHVSYDEEN